jgi:hypothetical protein
MRAVLDLDPVLRSGRRDRVGRCVSRRCPSLMPKSDAQVSRRRRPETGPARGALTGPAVHGVKPNEWRPKTVSRHTRNFSDRDPLLPNGSFGGLIMKLTTLALSCILALSGPFALAHGKRHHHSMRHHASRCVGGPNGTAGGPTTVSGTGPSTYGGNIPGARGCAR